jgi:lysozyme family protein
MNFDTCLDIVLEHEGLYSWDHQDPGGETKYGISKRAYPHVDIKALSKGEARSIYLSDYWKKASIGDMPALRLMVFDACVNQGVVAGVSMLQGCMPGIKADGIVGPKTLGFMESLNRIGLQSLLKKYAQARMDRYRKNKNWHHFGGGWAKRLLDVSLIEALNLDDTIKGR